MKISNITPEFIKAMVSELYILTGKQFITNAYPHNGWFFTLSDDDFAFDIFGYNEKCICAVCNDIIAKRYNCGTQYVSQHDMHDAPTEMGEYEPVELGVTEKTKPEALAKRIDHIMPEWVKYFSIQRRKMEAEFNAAQQQKSFESELNEKYKIHGHSYDKVGYVKDTRVSIQVSGDKADVKIHSLGRDKVIKVLEFLKGL